MPCNPKCAYTASVDGNGRRLMVSMGDNSKFPKETVHPMCGECSSAALEEAKLAVLFDNDWAMVEQYQKMLVKHG